jgi:hypothetical protein
MHEVKGGDLPHLGAKLQARRILDEEEAEMSIDGDEFELGWRLVLVFRRRSDCGSIRGR